MKKNYSDLKGMIRGIEGLIEVVIISLAYLGVWVKCYMGSQNPLFAGKGQILLVLLYAFLVFVLFYMSDGFQYGHRDLPEVIVSQWISLVIVNVVTYFQLSLIGTTLVNAVPILLLMVAEAVLAMGISYASSMLYHRMYVPKDMLMIYGTEKAVDLKFKMDKRPDKYVVTRVMSYQVGAEAICAEIAHHDAVILNDVPAQVRNDILKFCYTNQVRTYVVPKISDIIQRGGKEIKLFDTPLYLVTGTGLNPVQRILKRMLDIALCVVALIPGLPIMAGVALAIKLEDGGPVFYRQTRVTRGGKEFEILKFRSMIVNAEKDGRSIPAIDHDPRITRVGNVIRPTRLDELPQVLNILCGDMSWVGPRPERVQHMEEYAKEVPEFPLRTKVKGGLTGYAQIYGKYNTSAYDKLRLDLMYIENYSLFLDLKLILMTVQIVLKKESTEGFDRAEEMEAKRKELVEQENGSF